MSKKKYRIVYESKFYDASETMEILKKCPPDMFFKLYHKYRKETIHHLGDNTMKTSRLDRIEASIANLAEKVDSGFKQVNTRLDNVEARLDNVEKRLDYNNLKKLPESNT